MVDLSDLSIVFCRFTRPGTSQTSHLRNGAAWLRNESPSSTSTTCVVWDPALDAPRRGAGGGTATGAAWGPLYQHIVTGNPYDKNLCYPYSLLVRLALEVMEVSQGFPSNSWMVYSGKSLKKSHENG